MGRPLPSELRNRLRPILLLLSSGNSGEVLAAAGKIDLLLRKHDLDWHDFCDYVAAAGAVAPLPQGQAPSPASGADTGGRQIDAEQLLSIIDAIREAGVRVSPSSQQFLNSMECRATAYATATLSEKQHAWLIDLASQAAAKGPSP